MGAATTNNSGSNYGKLLDLPDLDEYLLSLLVPDLSELGREAQTFLAKLKTNDGNLWSSNATSEEQQQRRERNSNDSGNPSFWKDLLAVATIYASRGQTPGARALGVELVERNQTTDHQQRITNHRSTWSLGWLMGILGINNYKNNDSFLHRLLIYGILRVMLPRIYERWKAKALKYVEQSEKASLEEETTATEQISLRLQSKEEDSKVPEAYHQIKNNHKQKLLGKQRRRLVVQTIFRWIDVLVPSMRLALVLSCWKRNKSAGKHGGNLALWWSGLAYQSKQQKPTNVSNGQASSNNNSNPTSIVLPLFVLYAHRRWFHREVVELLWNRLGRSLLVVQGETSRLWSDIVMSLRNEWSQFIRIKQRLVSSNSSGSQLGYSQDNIADTPCALCGKSKMVIPYRLVECCGAVACYVCLWERIAADKKNHQNTARVSCPVCTQSITRCEPL